MDNKERIGQVVLDYSNYPGKDLYSDGNVEEELLELAVSGYDFEMLMKNDCKWPILYHLSPARENIVEWLPIGKTETVLEIGSGCGAITGALSRKAAKVTCIELSKRRSLINAYRHRDDENIEILLGNFIDVYEKLTGTYDYITLIGVLEYAQSYVGGEKPAQKLLEMAKKLLKPGGKIIVAIENKYGLKYWAGCKEDHVGKFYKSMEGYEAADGVRTYSKGELEEMTKDCAFAESVFYYPYPDYKFPTMIYSDSYLPQAGELSNNIRNFDMDRIMNFDETKVFDNIVRDGLFPVFSNSFLLILEKGN